MYKPLLPSWAAKVALCSLYITSQALPGSVVGITDVTVANGDPSFIDSDGSNVLDFTVASGTYSRLSPASSASGYAITIADLGFGKTGTEEGGLRNIWGQNGTEVDGLDAMLNLDLSRTIVNGGDDANLDIMFGATLEPTGAVGAGNDIFLFEVGRFDYQSPVYNDDIHLSALDINGVVIGDQSIVFGDSIWGDTGKDLYGTDDGGESHEWNILGVAFDVGDFDSSGSLSGVAGVRVNVSGGIDLISAGYNLDAVPEPSVLSLLSGLLLLGLRRRR